MDVVGSQSRPIEPGQASTVTADARSPALESDFETFLVMLTTQLQNQDPLNPLESTDFAVQLATFSGVEQQVRTNDLLAEMVDGKTGGDFGQLASWVGLEARVVAPASFSGTPIDLFPAVSEGADEARLIVTNSSGVVVGTEALPLTSDIVAWAGTDPSGSPLPADRYRFEVESRKDGDVLDRKEVAHYAVVNEARMASGQIEIVTSTGARIPASDVTAIRKASE